MAPTGAESVKLPSWSETVPLLVPFSRMLAPMTASPPESVMVPLTVI